MQTKATWTIFAITLPLVDVETFMAYKLKPIQFRTSENQLKQVTSKAEFRVIIDYRNRYFMLNMQQMAKCHRMNSNVLVCPKQQMTFTAEAQIWKCELNLFLNQSGTQCSLEETTNTSTWIQLHVPNAWIFSTKEPANVTAVCDTHKENLVLHDTAILKIDPTCFLKGTQYSLAAPPTVRSQMLEAYPAFGNVQLDKPESQEIISTQENSEVLNTDQFTELHNNYN
ncbi:uncharacterized protein LOC115624853 [Scaptodrosophila lebanonensis]|uniref:Uncharacterized protein LOC115624853 n=1 Tax=Drosophila lebanonensis TaxID=7225 RepID=A0A6J2TK88_DROLE|nr:uncharacterized protein LOC115624853 [Scaptodrosophila lebanonensis]